MIGFKIDMPTLVQPGVDGGVIADAVENSLQRNVVARVTAGLNVYDQPAKPLVPGYAKAKQRKGLKPVRDLTYSGEQMRDLTTEQTADGAVIKFQSPAMQARAMRQAAIEDQIGASPNDIRSSMSQIEFAVAKDYASRMIARD